MALLLPRLRVAPGTLEAAMPEAVLNLYDAGLPVEQQRGEGMSRDVAGDELPQGAAVGYLLGAVLAYHAHRPGQARNLGRLLD